MTPEYELSSSFKLALCSSGKKLLGGRPSVQRFEVAAHAALRLGGQRYSGARASAAARSQKLRHPYAAQMHLQAYPARRSARRPLRSVPPRLN